MPVLVTGAEHAVGRATVRALLRAGGEVRVFLDPDRAPEGTVTDLRNAGVKVARGTLDDEGLLELALEQVHTVVHAGADPVGEAAGILDDVASVLSAALGAGCRRVILVSHYGADEPRGNPYLEACSEAERLLAEAPLETVVVQRTLTYGTGDGLTEALAESTAGAIVDAQHVPVWIDDLAAAVVAADARGREVSLPHLVVPLGGPQLTSLGEFVALLGGQVLGGFRGAVSRAWPGDAPLPEHAIDLLSRDLVPPKGTPTAGTTLGAGAARVRADVHGAPP